MNVRRRDRKTTNEPTCCLVCMPAAHEQDAPLVVQSAGEQRRPQSLTACHSVCLAHVSHKPTFSQWPTQLISFLNTPVSHCSRVVIHRQFGLSSCLTKPKQTTPALFTWVCTVCALVTLYKPIEENVTGVAVHVGLPDDRLAQALTFVSVCLVTNPPATRYYWQTKLKWRVRAG